MPDHPGIDTGFAQAEVILPQGWSMVSPFTAGKITIPVGYLRNGYFGFGPFDLTNLTFQKSSLSRRGKSRYRVLQG